MLRPLALILIAAPAFAESPTLPPEITALIDRVGGYCTGEFTLAPDAISQPDLNGDGTTDWLVDGSGYSCADSVSLYCGTGGCPVDTLIDGKLGALLLRSFEIVAEGEATYIAAPNDQGETVRFLWSGSDWVLQ
jgi:hypothetical protein